VASSSEGWPPLDRAAIDRHVTAGNTVFVDVTADWCITCQVNKKLVIEDDRVAERLVAAGVFVQRGDWTAPDQVISDYLASFGRYGIPFNVVYGPAAPDGLPLPELLTVGAVLEALDTAAGVPTGENTAENTADP
jgi:suppressor for copper-sensitivity B